MSESGPKFAFPEPTSLIDAFSKAKATLRFFRTALAEQQHKGAFHGVKVHFPKPTGIEGSHIWLSVNECFADIYFCSPIELPSDFVGLKMGETKLVTDKDIEDWMILDGGTLYGGFSLRAIRSQLPPSERQAFDSHMGVTNYAGEDG